MIYVLVFFQVASLPLGWSYDGPSNTEVTLNDMGKITQP